MICSECAAQRSEDLAQPCPGCGHAVVQVTEEDLVVEEELELQMPPLAEVLIRSPKPRASPQDAADDWEPVNNYEPMLEEVDPRQEALWKYQKANRAALKIFQERLDQARAELDQARAQMDKEFEEAMKACRKW